jgi:DNA-binding NtrC family response regulator
MPLVLVVEDEPNVCEIISEAVAQLDCDVRIAATAAEALAIAKSVRPDAVLLDIVLPDARGTATFDELLKLHPGVPIIIVTANADEGLARETLKRGAFDYITKPFALQRLAQVLETALVSYGR